MNVKSAFANFGVDFGFHLKFPPIAWKKTKKIGFPLPGVEFYFQFGLSLTFSMNIKCSACGKSYPLGRLTVPISKTVYVGKARL
jgi:hypothetical protein